MLYEKYFSQNWDGHEDLCKGSPAQLKHGPRIAAGADKKKLSQSEPSCYCVTLKVRNTAVS